MYKKILSVIALILVLLSVISLGVSAIEFSDYKGRSQYYSYEYNSYDEISSAPDGYIARSVVFLNDLGIDTNDSKLSDLYFDGDFLYLLDAGRGRIIILNKDYSLNSIISAEDIIKPEKYSDVDISFVGAMGIYSDADGELLICDTERERVLIIKDNTLIGIINRPDTTALSSKIKFDARRAVKAGNNYYVAADSVISGTIVFNENYEFVRFFGSNNVTVTGEVLLNALQSIYMSDKQIASRRKFAASKITGLDVDNNGFLVVVSSDPDLTVAGSAVRRLNFKGSDITSSSEEKFGDKEITKSNANLFTDVSVDKDNFYSILDTKYGRVFVYSESGVLVSEFGGIGDETGLFKSPVAVETADNDIIVLDDEENSFTVFNTTGYSKTKRELLSIIDTGKYGRIEELADKLLNYNTNCQYAYYAKGFVEQSKGNYESAMSFYKQANDREAYAGCYKLWRSSYVKSHFTIILFAIILLIVAFVFALLALNNGLKKKEGMVYAPLENKAGFPIYCLFHPADGFFQIKRRKVLSPVWLAVIVVLLVYITIMRFFEMGYIHNINRAQDFNLLITLAKTVGVIAIFVISNWAICTLMDGKGKPMEILYTVVYSLLPLVLSLIINFLLSRILTFDEAVLMSIIMAIGEIWSGLVMFVGLLTIHEYSVGKAIFSIFLTIIGMAIIILLAVMFFTLISQTASFIQSLIQEYSLQH